MLDARLRRLIDPPLDRAGAALACRGVGADTRHLGRLRRWRAGDAGGDGQALRPGPGAASGSTASPTAWTARVARHSRLTDLGGFLDIVLDFIVYAGMVFAFAVADPGANALPAAFLLFAFMGTGSSFLAFAIMAAKRGHLDRPARPQVALLSGRADRGHRDHPVPGPGLPPAGVLRAIGPRLRGHVLADHARAGWPPASTFAGKCATHALNRCRPSAISVRCPSATGAGRRS